MWMNIFICELAHKEKDAGTASETKSQPEQKVVLSVFSFRNVNNNNNNRANDTTSVFLCNYSFQSVSPRLFNLK